MLGKKNKLLFRVIVTETIRERETRERLARCYDGKSWHL